jgi:hypothetical protein
MVVTHTGQPLATRDRAGFPHRSSRSRPRARKVVEHGSECGTSIAPELLNHDLYIGFLWV